MKPPIKKIATYFFIGLVGLIIVFMVIGVMLNLDDIATAIGNIVGALHAILLGCVMAYLLYPLTRFLEQFMLAHNTDKKHARSLSVAFSTLLLILMLFLFAYFIIPQLVTNIPPLIRSIPRMFQNSTAQLVAFLEGHGQDPSIVEELSDKIATFFNERMTVEYLYSLLNNVVDGVYAAARSVLNFVIGIIVMVYLLLSRDQFVGQGKKILFAVCKNRKTCQVILKHLRSINTIFSGFVSGKLLDSLIIGIICVICLTILRIPYALLISVIVGITNIIPVFGPFFGAIPSIFLLLLVSPGKCLVFIIFIIILQQVDGNIIGPKILGDSTGLSAFWVLFALLLFNHLMGFWGMLLGVPLFASFYYLVRELVNSLLRKRQLPQATMDYVHISSIDAQGNITYNDDDEDTASHPSKGLMARLRSLMKKPTIIRTVSKSSDDDDKA